jgi:hypothetical protein
MMTRYPLLMCMVITVNLIHTTAARGKTPMESAKSTPGPTAEIEMNNKRVLAETFNNLVRYVIHKKRLDFGDYGVETARFGIKAMDNSLADKANEELFDKKAGTVAALLQRANLAPVTFTFFWKPKKQLKPFSGAFLLFKKEKFKSLRVRLLWMNVPKKVPINPSVGEIDGIQPLREEVAESVRWSDGIKLEPYPPPSR